jgi:type IV pilus assembly protein PilC
LNEFTFTVTDAQGQRSRGTVLAASREAAMQILANRNYVVTKLRPVRSANPDLLVALGLRKPTMGGDQLMAFTQQLAAMLEAGMTLKGAVDIIAADMPDVGSRAILGEISHQLAEGASLTEILRKYPRVFSEQYVAMVQAGESSGRLPTILQRLATLLENARSMRKKVQGALYYPVLILAFTALIMVGLFVFGVPRFQEIYRGLGGELPTCTRIFLAIGNFLERWWGLLALALVGLGWGAKRLAETPAGQLAIDHWKLRAPLFGPLFTRLAIARFGRTLGSLHASGVPMVLSLELVARSVGNKALEKALYTSLQQVVEGEPLADTLRRSRLFTEMAVSMVGVGEQSGSLEMMLEKVADYYETEAETQLKAMTGMLEPLIMIGVGVMVGVMVIVMILPIFRMATLLFDK